MDSDLSIKIEDKVFNYRVGLMIQKGENILVEFNPNINFTTIPGGRVKTLENSIEALKRELNEEMHVEINSEEIKMKAFIENFFEMDNKKYHELYILYKININEDDIRFINVKENYDSVSSYYEWVNINELDKVNLLPSVLRTLRKDDNFESIIVDDLKVSRLTK